MTTPEPKPPVSGWTGKPCPHCKGSGFTYSHAHDNDRPCGACAGTGEEHTAPPAPPTGRVEDDSPPLGPGGCDDPLMH